MTISLVASSNVDVIGTISPFVTSIKSSSPTVMTTWESVVLVRVIVVRGPLDTVFQVRSEESLAVTLKWISNVFEGEWNGQ